MGKKTTEPCIYDAIKIDVRSVTPKYLQLANAISGFIEANIELAPDILPSINQLSYRFDLSRDTVQKSYNYLKSKGVVRSHPGKGYLIPGEGIFDK